MSVTDEYVLISWHAGEQNSDLLLGPGSELSELDILETKAVCSEPPFTSANRGCWWRSHHNDHFDIPTYVVTHIPTCSHHWSILPSSSFAFPSSVGCVHLPFLRGYPGGNNLYMYPLSDPWWWMPEKSHIYLSMIKSKTMHIYKRLYFSKHGNNTLSLCRTICHLTVTNCEMPSKIILCDLTWETDSMFVIFHVLLTLHLGYLGHQLQ